MIPSLDPSPLSVWSRGIQRFERWGIYYVIRFFRIRSTTEHIARGFAIGLVVNFFPTFGLGMLISGFLAKALGGSAIAGLVGGASLSFFWPALFYLNMRTGGIFRKPSIMIEDFQDLTPKLMDSLVWGKTFTVGAIVNSLLAGLAAYLIVLLLYHRIRPSGLAYFRRHARDHQHRFRHWKPRSARSWHHPSPHISKDSWESEILERRPEKGAGSVENGAR